MTTRREFLTVALAAAGGTELDGAAPEAPWYRRALRWGQTNITEKDPARYDIAWWREYWKRTEVQGVIINAGGIVAYYPSKYPLHHRAAFLHGRDLFGELAKAAHDDGLAVLARMDSNRTAEDFFEAHPDWFARDAKGDPYRAADKYITCINSPYYDDYIPGILTEIIERSRPEGLTDNSWAGLGRDNICYCENCARKFQARTGTPLPRTRDWDDPAYRRWIEWNYARRIEVWELNNRTAKAAGGPHCLWIGMNSGSVTGQSRSFRDIKAICERTEMMLLDHQSRSESGFQQNADTGKLIHGLLGWDKVMPESMAMYQAGRTAFRVASKPAAEARMWMIEGFAGGIQPWWHHVGAYHEDRRAYKTAEPVMRWHKAHEQYLVNRRPLASVGLVWSQRNTDFYGRDHASELVEQPYTGWMQALVRARVPYVPLNIDCIDRDGGELAVLILPNIGAMSDSQCASVRRFAARGGAIIATGDTSLCDQWGDSRSDFALADLFGASAPGRSPKRNATAPSEHTYLRLSPELRGSVWGPKAGDEPATAGSRHPVLDGFEETDILPYGATLEELRTARGAVVPLTFVPPFPVYPPETAWMRTPRTDIPGLVIKGRVAYLPAGIDRCFARENLPDHGDLLANIVRWAAGGRIPLHVSGRGLVDCNAYIQPGRAILHVVNLTSTGAWRAPVHELIPIGPLSIKLRLPKGVQARRIQFLVSREATPFMVQDGWATFEIKSILDHELVVIG